jgi:hypothetical protein
VYRLPWGDFAFAASMQDLIARAHLGGIFARYASIASFCTFSHFCAKISSFSSSFVIWEQLNNIGLGKIQFQRNGRIH